jgi:hypothetical protein
MSTLSLQVVGMRVYVVMCAMEFDDRTMEVVQSVHTIAEGALAEVKRISLEPG